MLCSLLLDRDRPVGSLNIYSRSAGACARNDRRLASVFAIGASIFLTDAGADETHVQRESTLQEAPWTEQVVARPQSERLWVATELVKTRLTEAFFSSTALSARRAGLDVVGHMLEMIPIKILEADQASVPTSAILASPNVVYNRKPANF